jgi:hypothetical protein
MKDANAQNSCRTREFVRHHACTTMRNARQQTCDLTVPSIETSTVLLIDTPHNPQACRK